MPAYQTILVGIDLSDESEHVVRRSLRLCNGKPERIHLIHVCEHPITGYGELTGKNHMVTEIQIRQGIFPKMKALASQFGIEAEHLHIEFGEPAEQIHDLADGLGAELIVVGSHGKAGIRALLGSTASSVVHGAHCDVLTVRIQE